MAVTWITASQLANPSDPNAGYAAEFASWVLYKLTAEKYPGIRTSTEWLGLDGCNPTSCYTFTDYGDFTWVTTGVPSAAYRSVKLRGQPVVEVLSVITSDGVAASGEYKVANHSRLVTTSPAGWNLRQGINVTYRHGTKPPVAGVFAAIRLADELVLAMNEDDRCALPINTQSASRQGIDIQLFDPASLFEKGFIGLYEVDLFIQAANPGRAKKRAKVFSPNLPRGERY